MLTKKDLAQINSVRRKLAEKEKKEKEHIKEVKSKLIEAKRKAKKIK